MEWGPQLKKLLKLQEQGMTVAALDARPELSAYEQQFWDAYQILDDARQWGPGFPQPITMSEIESYAGLNGFVTDEDHDDLIRFVKSLDREYLERHARRKRTEQEHHARTQSSH